MRGRILSHQRIAVMIPSMIVFDAKWMKGKIILIERNRLPSEYGFDAEIIRDSGHDVLVDQVARNHGIDAIRIRDLDTVGVDSLVDRIVGARISTVGGSVGGMGHVCRGVRVAQGGG